MAVANNQVSYMPPAHLRQFENDLATLPAYFAEGNDVVLIREEIAASFTDQQSSLGFIMPSFVRFPDEIAQSTLPLKALCPWGWSPAVHKILKPFEPLCHDQWFLNPMHPWKTNHRLLLSRETGYRLLAEIDASGDKCYDLVEIPALPKKLSTLPEIENVIHFIKPPALLKTPWSASGRGLFKIRDDNEHAENNLWVRSKLKQQGFLFAESYLDKILDLSFHFRIDNEDVRYIGYNFFETDESGQFLGCYTNMPTNAMVDESLLMDAIEQGSQILKKALVKSGLNHQYQGPVGVDALLFRNKQNQIKLHPCIEVNLRHSMGLLNIHIRKYIHPTKQGKWQISMMDQNTWDEMGKINKIASDSNLEDGLIAKGIIGLTPAPQKKGFMAWMQMEP